MTRWFRKHSKILMVILAVFALAMFGVGDAVLNLTRFGRGTAPEGEFKDEVVATWGNNQEIKQSDLGLMLARHFQVQRFLEKVMTTAEANKADYRPLAAPVAPIQGDERASRSFVNEQLVERFILARKAEKEGLVYTDGMVDDYLDMLSGGLGLSPRQLSELNREANSRQVSYEAVRRHLRQELMAQQMRILSSTGFQMVANPTEGAELFQKYSELLQCDVMPVNVDTFSSVSETPSAAELSKIYEQGKYEYPDPTGKRPGFKRPNRVAVQYIMADNEAFIQNEINKLTAEQVQAEYDRLVAAKDNLVMEEVPRKEDKVQPDAPAVNRAAEGAGNSQPEQKPESDKKPVADKTPAEGAPANAPAAPANETPAAEEKKEDSQEEKKDGQSSRRSTSTRAEFQYVSLRQDADQESAENKPAEQQPADDKPTEQKPAEEKAAEQKPAEQKPAETSVAPPAVTPAAENKPQDGVNLFDDDKAPELRPRPLADVADKVKRKLVAETVTANVDKAMKAAEEELSMHESDLMAWESSDPKTRGKQPEMDYQEIAKRFGLVAGETELVDFNAFGETAIGKAFIRPNQFSFGTIAQRIFGDYDRINKFAVERQTDLHNGNQYLYWLTAKEDAMSVPFEECKEDVEKFWKRVRMIDAAVKKAQSIADELNSSQAKLKEKYGETVTSTGEFAWFSAGGQQPMIGQPLGVTNPGDDFMKSVFALSTNKCGVAVNGDQTVVYVVQITSERKTIDTQGTEYVENQFLARKSVPGEVQQLMTRYAQEYNLDFNQELQDEMGLKFLRQ